MQNSGEWKVPEPTLTALGVYRVPHLDNDLINQLRSYYFFGNSAQDRSGRIHDFIQRCTPLVLFELLLENLDERFSIADFTQEMPEAPHKAWQAAYDEAVLSPDGSKVLSQKPLCTRGLRSGRVAFYFHFYDRDQPMSWSYGEFLNPPVCRIPRRLWDLMPYSPVD